MKFGLIGHPIGHSLSPAMFKACYPGLDYDLIETPDFGVAMDIFRKEYDAVNVTAPFKSGAFSVSDIRDEASAITEAANVLVRNGNTISAFNTDYSAVRLLLEDNLPSGARPAALVLGCGGAGRAAALAASRFGLETYVANRTFAKAAEFCKRAGGMTPLTIPDALSVPGDYGVIIYTLPVMIPEAEPLRGNPAMTIEANYRDPHLYGPNYISGKKWLAAQAITGFGTMTGTPPDPGCLMDIISQRK